MTNNNLNLSQMMSEALSGTVTQIFSFIPVLIGASIVFILGLVIASWVKKIVVKILKTIKLTSFVEKLGLKPFLKKADLKIHLEEIIGELIRWFIVLLSFMATVNILGLTTVSDVLTGILAYLPNIVSAIFILTLGILLAGLVESFVKGAIGQLDIKLGRLLGKTSSYLVVIFTTLAAIGELGIAQSFINILFIGVIATLTLGIGLAVGLGAKDLVAEVLKDWYEKFKKDLKE